MTFQEGNKAALKYDAKTHPRLIKAMASVGATDIEIAEELGVDVRTLYRWRHDHKAVCQALKTGKAPADDRVERSLFQRALGFTFVEQQAVKVRRADGSEVVEIVEVERFAVPDTTANIFWLKNRRKDEWRDKNETALTGGDGKPLVPVINVSMPSQK